jgi:hypothetical protein
MVSIPLGFHGKITSPIGRIPSGSACGGARSGPSLPESLDLRFHRKATYRH